MRNLQDLELFSIAEEERETYAETLQRFRRTEANNLIQFFRVVLPIRLCVVLLVVCFFVARYYVENCDQLDDGSWVSKPIYMIKNFRYNLWAFTYRRYERSDEECLWSMPS